MTPLLPALHQLGALMGSPNNGTYTVSVTTNPTASSVADVVAFGQSWSRNYTFFLDDAPTAIYYRSSEWQPGSMLVLRWTVMRRCSAVAGADTLCLALTHGLGREEA